MNSNGLKCVEIDVTPVLAGTGAYSSGNQVGGIHTLTHACIEENRIGQLQSLTVIDIDNQKAALTMLFFNQVPSVTSVDQGAFAITAAALKSQCIGMQLITAASYTTVASKAVTTLVLTNYFLQSLTSTQGNLYAAVVTTGTPTYTTTSSLVFKYVFAQHY